MSVCNVCSVEFSGKGVSCSKCRYQKYGEKQKETRRQQAEITRSTPIDPAQTKTCVKCSRSLSVVEFHRYSNGSFFNQCKSCKNEENRQRKKERREQFKKKPLPEVDLSITRECIKCHKIKPLSGFYPNPDYKYGRMTTCAVCETQKQSKLDHERRQKARQEWDKDFLEYLKKERKVCPKCKIEKPFSEYRSSPRYRDGMDVYCKDCFKVIDQKQHSAYYLKNRQFLIEKTQKYYEENKEKIAESIKLERKTDPEKYRQIDQQHYYRRMGLIRKWKGISDFDETHVRYLEDWQSMRCFYCNRKLRKNVRRDIHLDHIVPLSRSGSHLCNNIVMACQDCNNRKSDKFFGIEWKPDTVESLPEDLFFLSPEKIREDLEGLANWKVFPEKYAVRVEGNTTVRLYVLSSFACSERNPYSFQFAVNMKASDPDALFLFDTEWRNRFPNIVNMLQSKVGISDKTGARKLDFSFVEAREARKFLDQYHVMGFGTGTHYAGLKDVDGELYGLGVFYKRDGFYENIRMAFKGHVSGGMSKIIKSLWEKAGKLPIKSFVDSRYADGGGCESVGFSHQGMTLPSYKWMFTTGFRHQMYFSNPEKVREGLLHYFDQYSDEDNVTLNGIFRLWVPPLHRILLDGNPSS